MRYEIRSIGVWAYLKIGFFLNLLIGFIGGLFFAMFMSFQFAVMDNLGLDPGPGMAVEDLPMGVILIMMPIIFAIGGAVFYTLFGLIFVLIYNLVAKITGGFEMELIAVEPSAPVKPYVAPVATIHQQPVVPPPPPPAQPTKPNEGYPPPWPEEPPPPAGDDPK